MNRYLAMNQVHRADWSAHLVLEDLVRSPIDHKRQTPDGQCYVHEAEAELLKREIDLLLAVGPQALALP